MGNSILIIGASGTGKSSSIRNLDPKTTFLINVINKPLPFKSFKSMYKLASKENPNGNYFATDNYLDVIKVIERVNANRPEIKTLIIDDIQYILLNAYMRKCQEPLKPKETPYQKYSDLAYEYWMVMTALAQCRKDLITVALSHSEYDEKGKSVLKTVGRLLSEKLSVEGMFTMVLHTTMVDSQYKFQTQSDDSLTAKSPMGMFKDKYIDNDLAYVLEQTKLYYDDEIEEQNNDSELNTVSEIQSASSRKNETIA